mmetsp:Transcript_16632/g.39164  ORF Transcript_16632/g.39164 Transcript_16632/m.39164 type:complete len:142 (+) Transcript_16632:36-461(+)|eukprot:s2574_g6.t1
MACMNSKLLVLVQLMCSGAQAAVAEDMETPEQHAQRRLEWNICTSLCGAAGTGRMVLSDLYLLQCYRYPRDNGIIRILSRDGVRIVATQPCAYGSGMGATDKPLRVSRVGSIYDKHFQLTFTDRRATSLQVKLTDDIQIVG